jgi:hypothetical protein
MKEGLSENGSPLLTKQLKPLTLFIQSSERDPITLPDDPALKGWAISHRPLTRTKPKLSI